MEVSLKKQRPKLEQMESHNQKESKMLEEV